MTLSFPFKRIRSLLDVERNLEWLESQNLAEGGINVEEGSVQGTEITDPSAPATNVGVLYYRDNGAGKTQLCVRFATGAIQVIATEP